MSTHQKPKEKTGLQVISQRSELQLQQQRNDFYIATTKEEQQVAAIVYSEEKTIKERSLSHDEQEQKAVHNEIIDFMGLLTITIGASRLNDTELTAIYTASANFIKRQFGFLKISDLQLLLEYIAMDSLHCDTRLYNGIISIEYVSRMLRAYCYERKELLGSVKAQTMTQLAKLPSPPPSPAEQVRTIRDIISWEYNAYKRTGNVFDTFDFIYDFCQKTGRLKFITKDKQKIQAAAKWGQEKAREVFKSKMGSRMQDASVNLDNLMAMGDNMQHIQRASKKFARIYCLKLLFDSVDLDQFLQGISENDFAQ